MKICPNCRYNNREGYMFCEDCGEDLASVKSSPRQRTALWQTAPQEPGIVLHVPGAAQLIALALQTQTVLGRYDPEREQQPDVDLTAYEALSKGVSTRHATIQHSAEGVQIIDLGSTNGTYVNGRRLIPNQHYVLRDGDEIRFSRLVTRIQINGME